MEIEKVNEIFDRINKFLLYSFAVASIVLDGGSTAAALRIGLTEGNKYTGAAMNYLGPYLGLAFTVLVKTGFFIFFYKSMNWMSKKIKIELLNKASSVRAAELGSLAPKVILAWGLLSNSIGHFLATGLNILLILNKI